MKAVGAGGLVGVCEDEMSERREESEETGLIHLSAEVGTEGEIGDGGQRGERAVGWKSPITARPPKTGGTPSDAATVATRTGTQTLNLVRHEDCEKQANPKHRSRCHS